MLTLLKYQINTTGLSNGLVIPAGFIICIPRIINDALQTPIPPVAEDLEAEPPVEAVEELVNKITVQCITFLDEAMTTPLTNDAIPEGYIFANLPKPEEGDNISEQAFDEIEAFLTVTYGAENLVLLNNQITS